MDRYVAADWTHFKSSLDVFKLFFSMSVLRLHRNENRIWSLYFMDVPVSTWESRFMCVSGRSPVSFSQPGLFSLPDLVLNDGPPNSEHTPAKLRETQLLLSSCDRAEKAFTHKQDKIIFSCISVVPLHRVWTVVASGIGSFWKELCAHVYPGSFDKVHFYARP